MENLGNPVNFCNWNQIHQIYPAIFTGIPLGFYRTLPDIQSRNNNFTRFSEASNLLDICEGILALTKNLPKTTGNPLSL